MSSSVHVVGAGLIGTSIGLALSRVGTTVTLSDPSPTAAALAADLGAGCVDEPTGPDVVVVAAPPDVAASVILSALRRWPHAAVTDVASVKSVVLADVSAATTDDELARYVGSHPMAGRERSGAVAAQADLFKGRTWVVCAHTTSDRDATARISELAASTGAAVVSMNAAEHDTAVAYVSHLPQIAASLVASRLRELPDEAVALAGQGIRDVTRIAERDPLLWTQILAG
ncbi:MAG: prephenate dehydrogenase/arogenate dehydrogenase family protein, partial [Allobranchiibius sp.]